MQALQAKPLGFSEMGATLDIIDQILHRWVQHVKQKLQKTYSVVVIHERDSEGLHSLYECLYILEDVLVDQGGETSFVIIGVASTMDDPHLFDESTLPTFSCSYRKR